MTRIHNTFTLDLPLVSKISVNFSESVAVDEESEEDDEGGEGGERDDESQVHDEVDGRSYSLLLTVGRTDSGFYFSQSPVSGPSYKQQHRPLTTAGERPIINHLLCLKLKLFHIIGRICERT